VVARLEATRDLRPLLPHEESLCKELKVKTLGLSSLQRTTARQESIILWLKEGDTQMSFVDEGTVVLDEGAKADLLYSFFHSVLGTPSTCSNSLNLDALNLRHLDSDGLGERFTEDEVWNVIRSLMSDKASGLDGFITRFLQAA
jgi:hypothetical protein